MECYSAEFVDQATLQDVVAAYRLLLRRNPDPQGIEHFTKNVTQGIKIDELVSQFTNSGEYRTLANQVTAIDLGGYFVCVDPNEPDIGRNLVLYNEYEPHVRRAVVDLFHAGETFVDIGANVGCISLLAAKIAGPDGQVIAFEPNPSNLKRLYAGIVLNQYTNIRVMPFAASDSREFISMSRGVSNTSVNKTTSQNVQADYVQSIVLDEELSHLRKIDFVKIDIEGHEPFAIKGFKNLIRKHSPVLLTEFSPHCLRDQGMEPGDYLVQLFELYSHLKVITPFGDSMQCTDADAIMAFWRKLDEEVTAHGSIAEGMLHFDIIATNH